MKFPKPVFKGGGESLEDILENNRREEEARRERFREFALADFFLNLRSRDKLTKMRVRRALPALDDAEVVDLALRLMREASADYLQLRMQWQREAVDISPAWGWRPIPAWAAASWRFRTAWTTWACRRRGRRRDAWR